MRETEVMRLPWTELTVSFISCSSWLTSSRGDTTLTTSPTWYSTNQAEILIFILEEERGEMCEGEIIEWIPNEWESTKNRCKWVPINTARLLWRLATWLLPALWHHKSRSLNKYRQSQAVKSFLEMISTLLPRSHSATLNQQISLRSEESPFYLFMLMEHYSLGLRNKNKCLFKF